MSIRLTGALRGGPGCLALFALPFAGVGVFVLWLAARDVAMARRVTGWREVPATIVSSELEEHSGDDSTTWQATATYRYEVNGTPYTSTRVSIHGGADNIGDFQKTAYAEIRRHQDAGAPFRCYVNPHDPADAVLFRDSRWGMILFKATFGLVFGGAGFGLLAAALYGRRRSAAESTARARHPGEPWLRNPDWAGGLIRSSSKLEMLVVLGFAVLWNCIAVPISILALTQGDLARERARLLVLIFPLVGLGLGVAAAYLIIRYVRYGNSTFRLAKVPGVIGGPLKGIVEVPVHVKAQDGFHVALRSVHRHTTGSGRNRSTNERVLWEDERVIVHELAEGDPRRSAIPVLFAIPRDCRPTDTENSDNQHLWRLEVRAKTPGPDFAARFEVPVFVTSESAADFRLDADAMEKYERKVEPAAVFREQGLRIEMLPTGRSFVFPAARQKGASAGLTGFVAIWAGIVVAMAKGGAPRAMTIIFGLVDALLCWAVLMMWLYWRRIEVGAQGVTLRSGMLGFSRAHALRRDEVAEVAVNAGLQSGDKSFFDLKLRTKAGRAYTAGTRIAGRHAAELIAREVRQSIDAGR